MRGQPASPLRMLTMVMNWDAFRRLGDPCCRLPGVECRSAVPAPLCTLCRHRGAPDGLWCTMLLLAALSPFYRGQGVDCKPGRRHILHWPMSARGRKALSAPKGLPAPCQHCTAPLCVGLALACSASLVKLRRTRWKSAGGPLQEPDSTPPCLAISW